MKKSRKLLISLQIVLYTSLALVVSFAWIPRSWNPQVNYSDISLQTTGSLVVAFNDKDFTDIDLNQYTDVNQFTLKQVSTSNGYDFVSADFAPIVSGGVPVYSDKVADKYIETKFSIKTYGSLNSAKPEINQKAQYQHIFFHPDSIIDMKEEGASANASYALRVSIQILNDKVVERTLIFARKPETITDTQFTLKGADKSKVNTTVGQETLVYADYHKNKNALNTTALADYTAYSFDHFDGTQDDPNVPQDPTDLYLTTFDSTVKAKDVIVRIWLEGCDEHCKNDIVGSSLKLILKFTSKTDFISGSEILQ